MTKKTPLRKCVGCGEMIAKKEMLRVVHSKDGVVKLDPSGKENGRGAYIHANRACFDQAVKTKGFERSFKTSIQPEIYHKLSEELMDLEQ